MVDSNRAFSAVTRITLVVALCVIMLGAYVRLSHAGLSCPDWPGCYGYLYAPAQAAEIEQANTRFPRRPVETDRAVKEMMHRYLAGLLGLLIVLLTLLAVWNRRVAQQPIMLPLALLALVVFQGLLGMWTVTMQLQPLIVLAHLLGAFATLAMLWWILLGLSIPTVYAIDESLNSRWRVILGICLLVLQIALGAWTSANYAALACPDFPTCQNSWWPDMNFTNAFVLWRELGINYEFGVLDSPARTAIHVTHRLGAVIVAAYWLLLSLRLALQGARAVRLATAAIVLLVIMQFALGISNVVFQLPIAVAVAHNANAALLLLATLSLLYVLKSRGFSNTPKQNVIV